MMAQLRKLAPEGILTPSATTQRSSVAPAPTSTSSQMTLSVTAADRSTTDRRPICTHVAFGLADRQARVEIVGRRADIPEIGVAQERADVTQILFDELLVQGADAFGGLVYSGSRAKADGCAICTPTT